MKTGRQKGDFSIENYKGERRWFSAWIDEVAAALGEGNRLPDSVTHYMLVAAFKSGQLATDFVKTHSDCPCRDPNCPNPGNCDALDHDSDE